MARARRLPGWVSPSVTSTVTDSATLSSTNFFGRSTVAFQAQSSRQATYVDASTRLGLARCTRHVVGFGIALADFDADGRIDLIQANGHVLDRARLGTPFAMRPVLLRNRGERFEDVADQAGKWFERPILGRGLAVGDLDDDGRPDVVVNALDAPAAVLRNTSDRGQHSSPRRDRSSRGGQPWALRGSHQGRWPRPGRTGRGQGVAISVSRQAVCILVLVPREAVDRIEVEWPWGRDGDLDKNRASAGPLAASSSKGPANDGHEASAPSFRDLFGRIKRPC